MEMGVSISADPDCLASTWKTELPTNRTQSYSHSIFIDNGLGANQIYDVAVGCNNGADDDRDGLIDYPADPECLTPNDQDESGEEAHSL